MKSFRRSCVLPANGDLHLERRELFVIFDNLILRASCIGRDFECAQHGLPRSTEVLLKDGKQIDERGDRRARRPEVRIANVTRAIFHEATSEERRVVKECVVKCRSGWST